MYVMILQSSCTVFLVLFLLSSPSTLINISSLKIDPIPSEYAVPTTATTSTSWMSNQLPLYMLNSTSPSSYFNPILLSNSSSSGSQFSGGFWYDDCTNSCFFGIIIFPNSSINLNLSYIMNDPVLVWSANRNDPMRGNATLKFTSKGDLLLENAKGNLVWSSNTSGKSVLGLKLTEIGNLVLFGNDHSIIWQSFDYPTDTLVRGQAFLPGQKLIASQSTYRFNQGLFSLTHELNRSNNIVAYIDSNPPQVYYNMLLEYETQEWLENILGQNASFNLTYQFSRLESNGHFNIYQFGQYNEPVIMIDLLEDEINGCDYPMACGRYGLCSRSNQCSCPEEVKNGAGILRQLDYRKPELGCTLSTNISCDDIQYHSLVELKNTTYFNFNQRQRNVNISLKDCKLACLRNCLCKALVYSYKYSQYDDDEYFGKVYPCLLISEVFSLKAMDMDTSYGDNISVFLKVQEIKREREKISSQDSSPGKGSRNPITIVASIIGSIISILLLLVFCFLKYKRRKMDKNKIDLHLPQLSGLPTRFSYDHLKSVTCNFSKKLGEGGFGSVFEGTLSNGIKVAVKCLDGFDQLIKKSFLAEVETIGNIHHVNLVKLIGYCAEESYTLLVYEYMPNGSLDKWIFHEHGKVALNWELRKKIIVDIAKGLAYLHEDCRHKILHLDIKPQNILLDENFNAKISDFGLAKLVEKDHSQIITTLRGTPGYIAPECQSLNIT